MPSLPLARNARCLDLGLQAGKKGELLTRPSMLTYLLLMQRACDSETKVTGVQRGLSGAGHVRREAGYCSQLTLSLDKMERGPLWGLSSEVCSRGARGL